MRVNSISRVDDILVSLSTVGVSAQQEQYSPPSTQLSLDEPSTNSLSHSLLQILRAELQRHQDTTASLKSERDALNEELDRRRNLETSGFRSVCLSTIYLTDAWLKQSSEVSKESSSSKKTVEYLWIRRLNISREKVTFDDFKGGRTRKFTCRLSFRERKVVSVTKRRGSRFVPGFLLDDVPLALLGTNPSSLARQQLEDRLRDALNIAVDLENRLVISQQGLSQARS